MHVSNETVIALRVSDEHGNSDYYGPISAMHEVVSWIARHSTEFHSHGLDLSPCKLAIFPEGHFSEIVPVPS